jgi:hypothetical protein
MAEPRNAYGVPTTYLRRSWSRIIDTMVGGSVANNDLLLRAAGVWGRKAPGTNGQFLKVISGAPDWATTQGGDGGVGYFTSAYQAADLSITNATTGTTFANTDLQLVLPAGGTYRFEINNFVFCHATPDFKTRLHWTGTATEVKVYHITIREAATAYFNQFEEAFEVEGLLTLTARHLISARGTLKVTVSGTLSQQSAQNTASATAIIGAARGSSAIAWQIG